MELLDQIAGGDISKLDNSTKQSNAYAREMAEKYGVDLQAEGLTGVIVRMTDEERKTFVRLLH